MSDMELPDMAIAAASAFYIGAESTRDGKRYAPLSADAQQGAGELLTKLAKRVRELERFTDLYGQAETRYQKAMSNLLVAEERLIDLETVLEGLLDRAWTEKGQERCGVLMTDYNAAKRTLQRETKS